MIIYSKYKKGGKTLIVSRNTSTNKIKHLSVFKNEKGEIAHRSKTRQKSKKSFEKRKVYSLIYYIKNDEILLLFGRNSRLYSLKSEWSLIGGSLKKDEKEEDALIREIKEESGISICEKVIKESISEEDLFSENLFSLNESEGSSSSSLSDESESDFPPFTTKKVKYYLVRGTSVIFREVLNFSESKNTKSELSELMWFTLPQCEKLLLSESVNGFRLSESSLQPLKFLILKWRDKFI